MRVVYCGSGWFPIVDMIRARLPEGAELHVLDRETPSAPQLAEAQVILPSNWGLPTAAFDQAPKLRLVQQPAAGFDGIDLDAARARSIPVCNAPSTNASSVAQAALFLILGLARRYHAAQREFRKRTIGAPLGRELTGRRLGLIGYGASGQKLAEAARAIGMNVLYVNSKSTPDDWDELLRTSDVISIHAPLNTKTRGLIDEPKIAKMKSDALLINVARGGLIERSTLETALREGRLGGVGLDTFWEEPWDPSDAIFQREDVMVMPHVAGSTDEAFERVTEVVITNIERVLIRGEAPLHRIA